MRVFSGLLRRFARPCRLLDGNGDILGEMRAFLSPLRYKNKMYLYGVNTEIGYNPEGYYLYIGPPFPDITESENLLIECGNDRYIPDRAEKVFAGEEPVYQWAVVRRMTEDEEDE